MNRTVPSLGPRACNRAIEGLILCGSMLLVGALSTSFPAKQNGAPGGDDWMFRWQAQQMYGRDPELLSALESENVERWCRCLAIVSRYTQKGVQSMSDDECQEVVDALDDLCPNVSENPNYLLAYNDCRERLATAKRTARPLHT